MSPIHSRGSKVFGLVVLTWLACLALASNSSGQPANTGGAVTSPTGKTFIDYFLSTPIRGALTKDAWGIPEILPRDTKNGLEDTTLKDLPVARTSRQRQP